MIYAVIEKTRSNTKIPWTPLIHSYLDTRIEILARDGIVMGRHTYMSPDKLSLVSFVIWRSKAEMDEFKSEPLVLGVREYNRQHEEKFRITSKSTFTEFGELYDADQHEPIENSITIDEFLLSREESTA